MWTNLEWMNKQTNNKMCLCMNVFFWEKKSDLFAFIHFSLWYRPDSDTRYWYQIPGIGHCILDQNISSHIWLRRISAQQKSNVFSALTPGERGVAEWWSFSSHSADLIKHLSRYNTHSMNIWPIRARRQVDRAVGCQVRNLWGVVLGRRCSLCPVSWPHPLSNQSECSVTLLKIKMLLNSLKQSFIYTECHL